MKKPELFAPPRDSAAPTASMFGGVELDVSHIQVDCLWCDQGMAHLLQVHDDESGIPAALALIDFGVDLIGKSETVSIAQAAPAVSYLIDLLKKMQTRGLPPRLEFVVVSHQDTDHWALINFLLNEVEKQGIPLKVGYVYYGGASWGEKALATMRRLGALASGVLPWTEEYSDYRNAKIVDWKPTELIHIGSVIIRTLLVNAKIAQEAKTPALRKNGTSAVIEVDFQGASYLFPGDATWQTLKTVTDILEAWKGKPLAPVVLMSAPHHGSLATIVPKHPATVYDFSLLEKFVNQTMPDSVVASAGVTNSHKHPYRVVLDKVGKDATDGQFGEHAIVAYYAEKADWDQEEIIKNIYTTVVTHGVTPVRAANWYFYTDAEIDFRTRTFEFDAVTKATVLAGSASSASKPVSALEALMRPSAVHRFSAAAPRLDWLSDGVPPKRVAALLPAASPPSPAGR